MFISSIYALVSIPWHHTMFDVDHNVSEDGRVLLHDGRAGRSRAQGTLQLSSEVTGTQYHPVMDNVFVTSDNRGEVCQVARFHIGRITESVHLFFSFRGMSS